MPETPTTPKDNRPDPRSARERLRQRFLRANTAVAVILVAVSGLAAAAVLFGYRAIRQKERIEKAERESRERLWESYLSQARAVRLAGHMGRRAEALTAISNAAAIRPSVALRSEAIASLALLDAQLEGPVRSFEAPWTQVDFPAGLDRYILASRGGVLAIHDAGTHQLLRKLDPSPAGPKGDRLIRGFMTSPDLRYEAAYFKNNAVLVWDLASGRGLFAYRSQQPGPEVAINLSRDGRLFGYYDGDREEVVIRELPSGAEVPHRARIGKNSFCFRPNRPELAAVADREVRLWNYQTGELLRSLPHPGVVNGLAWSPDGRRLAVSRASGDVHLWDLAADQSLVLGGHTEGTWLPVFSPDGRLLMTSSSDGTTRWWDTELGRLLLSTPEGAGLEFSRDGLRVGFEQPRSGYGWWRLLPSQGFSMRLGQGDRDHMMLNLDLSARGDLMAALVPGGFQLWDPRESTEGTYVSIPDLTSVIVCEDRPAVLLCRGGRAEFRSVSAHGSGGAGTFALGEPEPLVLPPGITVRFAASGEGGRTMAFDLADHRILVIDPLGERPPVYLEGSSRFLFRMGTASSTGSGRLAVSPDGRWVVVGYGFANHPTVWDARSGARVMELEAPSGNIAFSPNGRMLLTSGGNEYHLWRTADWHREWKRVDPTLAGVNGSMAFAGDGRMLALTRNRQEVELVDPRTGEELTTLIAPIRQSIRTLRLSHDGRRLAVGTANNLVQLWDLGILRRELDTLHLDWAGSSLTAARPLNPRPTASLPGAGAVLGLALGGAGLVALAALLFLHRHRRLIEEYAQTEVTALTQQRQLEGARVELMHSQKMKALGTLAAGIAHDFNNLLSVIRMSNKLIGRAAKNNPDLAEEVATIEEAVQQGKQVVGSMLGYSRERHDEGQPCDVDEVVEETVSLLSREFLSGIELTLTLDRSAPSVRIGRGRLEQMLLNLIVNAAEAMNGAGKLTVSVRTSQAKGHENFVLRPRPRPGAAWVELAVDDSGSGIAPEVLPRIFEPFFTTKNTGARNGTGLGLSMVYTIAEQEGLGLLVESAPGRGARFVVLLPAD